MYKFNSFLAIEMRFTFFGLSFIKNQVNFFITGLSGSTANFSLVDERLLGYKIQEWLKFLTGRFLAKKLANEKSKGKTVDYDQLIKAWRKGHMK